MVVTQVSIIPRRSQWGKSLTLAELCLVNQEYRSDFRLPMRVLYLTHRLPYAPNRGDRIRAYHTLSVLRGRAEVDLVSLVHDGNERAHQDDLRGLTDSVSVAPVPRL